MGIYRDAVDQVRRTPLRPELPRHHQPSLAHHAQVRLRRQHRTESPKYLTAFARFGWDNGKTESFAYTEVDQTFAEGVGANGAWWHRKQDRAGIAFVSNGIKKDHQNYLADGGLGFLLGDGALNYGRENIVESYYTVHVWRGIYLAPGVQHINNPGYNRDRGPVLVPSFRAHVEF
jgi:high affinity Mn2+ porin